MYKNRELGVQIRIICTPVPPSIPVEIAFFVISHLLPLNVENLKHAKLE